MGLKLSAAAVCYLMGANTTSVSAQLTDMGFGKDDYERACAVCHGRDAKGSGPMTPWLIRKPADLTTLATRSGGTFPTDALVEIIDGRKQVSTHGPREMPVWGIRFGGTDAGLSEAATRTRIRAIVDYLETLQR